MEYYDGQILKNSQEHKDFANWANTNGNKFGDTANGDGTYTVYEVKESETDKQNRVRGIRNQMLDESDKYMISDFPLTDEERVQMGLYRQYLRDYTKQDNWWESLPDGFADWRANIEKVDEILKESTEQEQTEPKD